MFHQMNPELRSITAICIVEDVSRCPLGYTPILRTSDLDADADLWRDGFFGRRITRYVCISKTQGRPEHAIQAIQILHDRELPPEGFSLIQQTVDTSQKPFKKKNISFKLANIHSNCDSIVEILAFSKLKSPPDGFEHIGDINGIHFCVRKISAVTRLNQCSMSYGILPGIGGGGIYPSMQHSMNDLSLNSDRNLSGIPDRSSFGTYATNSEPNSPAHSVGYPTNPLLKQSSNTLSHLSGLEGVPFTLRENLKTGPQTPKKLYIIVKSDNDIEQEYSYDFRTERDLIGVNGFDS